MANMATSIARDKLLSLGTCIGKLTKTGKFRRTNIHLETQQTEMLTYQ
jgi:ribosome biogenesis protein Nip4